MVENMDTYRRQWPRVRVSHEVRVVYATGRHIINLLQALAGLVTRQLPGEQNLPPRCARTVDGMIPWASKWH